jgi:hypothetical protein
MIRNAWHISGGEGWYVSIHTYIHACMQLTTLFLVKDILYIDFFPLWMCRCANTSCRRVLVIHTDGRQTVEEIKVGL